MPVHITTFMFTSIMVRKYVIIEFKVAKKWSVYYKQ